MDFVIAVLFFLLMFVDDAAAMIINDNLYDANGVPVLVLDAGKSARVPRHQQRLELYYLAAIGVIKFFGHSEAMGKTWLPPMLTDMSIEDMPFLGISFD